MKTSRRINDFAAGLLKIGGVNVATINDVNRPSVEFNLATDIYLTSPAPGRFLYGTFVAIGTSVTIDVEGIFQYAGGNASGGIYVLVGPPTSGRLRGTGKYSPILSGVSAFGLGEQPHAFFGNVQKNRKLIVTGLTPGATYAVEVGGAIIGGYSDIASPIPGSFNVAAFCPDETRMFFTSSSGNKFAWIDMASGVQPNIEKFSDSAGGIISTASSSPVGCAVTPNSAILMVAEYGLNRIAFYNTVTMELLGTLAVTGPWGILVISDTLAWVIKADGTIKDINPTTRAFLTNTYTVVAATVLSGCLNAAKTIAYFIGGTTLYRVVLATGAVSSVATGVTSPVGPFQLGNYVYVGGADSSVRAFDASTLASAGTVPAPNVGIYGTNGTGGVASISGSRDYGEVVYVSYNDGRWGYFEAFGLTVPLWNWHDFVSAPPQALPIYLQVSNVSEHIFGWDNGGQNKLRMWAGGRLKCQAASAISNAILFEDFLKVRVWGAT